MSLRALESIICPQGSVSGELVGWARDLFSSDIVKFLHLPLGLVIALVYLLSVSIHYTKRW